MSPWKFSYFWLATFLQLICTTGHLCEAYCVIYDRRGHRIITVRDTARRSDLLKCGD